MKPLIPQTVYIKRSGNENADAQLFFPPIMDKSILNGMPIPVVRKENQYILSKEELIELLGKTWDECNEYNNGVSDNNKEQSINQYFNNILNQ